MTFIDPKGLPQNGIPCGIECQDPEACAQRDTCLVEVRRSEQIRKNQEVQQRENDVQEAERIDKLIEQQKKEEDDDWSKLTPGKIQAMIPKQIGPVIVYPDNEYSRKLAIKLARARPGEMMALTIDELATLSEFFVWPPR